MFRRKLFKFYKIYKDPEIMSISPLAVIMASAVGIASYSIYRHLYYDSDYFVLYSRRIDADRHTDFGMKYSEADGNTHQQLIESTFQLSKYLKSSFPWNLIFNNVKNIETKEEELSPSTNEASYKHA